MSEMGQALVEYAILSFFVVLSLTLVLELFLEQGLSNYFTNLAAIIALPFP